jgi:uncharacterized protein
MDHGYFRWDPNKAASNVSSHKVTFEAGKEVLTGKGPTLFKDDDREDYGEIRQEVVGFDEQGRLLIVVISQRDDHIRIISVRKANKAERKRYEKNVT